MVKKVNEESIKSKTNMLTSKIFQMASRKYKYKCNYQSVISESQNLLYASQRDIRFLRTEKIFTPDVCFDVIDVKHSGYKFRTSNAIMDLPYTILVTPGELYTPYEKLLLPFDFWTWILVFVTFSMTFLSIFIINHMPEKIKDVVYGKKVRTPVWNVVGLIFGIGQTRLPDKSFARFILLLFIWFCLMFQVCFQSKMFEFLTSDPRRPSPKTFIDLIDQNYTMYTLSSKDAKYSGINQKGLNIRTVHPNDLFRIFMSKSRNASAKIALIIDEDHLQELNQYPQMYSGWNRIGHGNMFTSQQVIGFHEYAFYFRMLKKSIDNMIDTGHIENLVKRNYNTNSQNFDVADDDPRVLAMSDLGFGFWIWVGCCCVSIVGFVIEQLFRLFKKPELTAFSAERPISNVGTRYQSEQGELEEIDQDQVEEVGQEVSERLDQEQSEESDQEQTDVEETSENQSQSSQNQEPQSINQSDNISNKTEERNMEVHAEVHQADEMEESLQYFEDMMDSNERRQSLSHATDLPEAISNFMDIELLREASECQETIERDLDKNP
jgi:hypothetical protein